MSRMSSPGIVTKPDIADAIQRLASRASLEMSVHDVAQLPACAKLLAPNTRMYVSHLPGQSWADTIQTCIAACDVGFAAIPHVPVRRIETRSSIENLLRECVKRGAVREVLLIAGDYARPSGPFESTLEVMSSGLLAEHGIRSVSVAGHPEGHPVLSTELLRRAEQEKIACAARDGMQLTFLTQFFFESAPFFAWKNQLRQGSPTASIVAGLAGPASLPALIKFALKCGVGASLRVLTRKTGMLQLLVDHGPESLVRDLADEAPTPADSFHLFSFGGLTRTCAWLSAVRAGRFELNDNSGFAVRTDSETWT
jgi:methylenetetrahydrofolate reductase (NADPH)